MKKSMLNKKYLILLYILIAVFYLFMAWQIPYAHDDWDWGLDIGMERFLSGEQNSRYVGNFFVVVMTRSALAKTLIMGSVYFLIPFALASIVSRNQPDREKKHLAAFLIGNFLLLTMSSAVFRQTYGWVAGFANFVISALCLLLYLWQLLPLLDKAPAPDKVSAPGGIGLMLLGICMELFIENLSIFALLCSCVFCFISYKRTGKVRLSCILLTIGNLIGCAIMFSSSLYGTLVSTGTAVGGYRQIIIGSRYGLVGSVRNLVQQTALLLANIYCDNALLCAVILALMTFLLAKKKDALAWLKRGLIIINSILLCYLVTSLVYPLSNFLSKPLQYISRALSSGVFLAAVTAELFLLFWKDKTVFYKYLFLWAAALLIHLPLIITSESGKRVFFSSNTVLILFFLILLLDSCPHIMALSRKRWVTAVLVPALVVCVYFTVVFASVGSCTRQRMEIIRQAALTGAERIELPAYPHEKYLWATEPSSDIRMLFFKEFYGIDPYVEVIFLD